MKKLRRVLAARRPGTEPEATFFEKQFERIVDASGVPRPVRHYRVRRRDRTYFLDHAWLELGVWSKCDSVLAHANAGASHRDVERQNHIVMATGLQPIHFSYRHVIDHPAQVAATLTTLLRWPQLGPGTAAGRAIPGPS